MKKKAQLDAARKAAGEDEEEDVSGSTYSVRDPKTNDIITLTRTVYGSI